MSRPTIVLYTGVASGTLFLGTITIGLRSGGPGGLAAAAVAALGLVATLLVLGRLIYKTAR